MKQNPNSLHHLVSERDIRLPLRRTPIRARVKASPRIRQRKDRRQETLTTISLANIQYTVLQREQYYTQKRWKALIRSIQNQSDRICQGKIHASFLRETFVKSQLVFLAYIYKPYQTCTRQTRNRTYFLSFATVRNNVVERIGQAGQSEQTQRAQPADHLPSVDQQAQRRRAQPLSSIDQQAQQHQLYLDLLAADKSVPGLGIQLFQRVKQYAREHGFVQLQLSSVASVMNYWRKLGFRYGYDGNESKAIQEIASSCSDIIFQSDWDAEQHPQFKTLLQLLVESNLCHKQNCTSIDTSDEGYIMTTALA